VDDAFYRLIDPSDLRGELFSSTQSTASPWSTTVQHAAPVSSLLVRSIENCSPRENTRLSRVSVDLLGPVPIGEVWVTAKILRPGRQIELLHAEMLARGPDSQLRPVATATAWRKLTEDTSDVAHSTAPPLADLPNAQIPTRTDQLSYGFVHTLDWRWLTEYRGPGPGECWVRALGDLVEGETMTAMQRLFAVADIANGVGAKLPARTWSTLNTDLTVNIYRAPVGEWTGIRAETAYGPDGVGTSAGTLFDQQGAIGYITQSVLVRRRAAKMR
jgi:Thioesterase-like superfamily